MKIDFETSELVSPEADVAAPPVAPMEITRQVLETNRPAFFPTLIARLFLRNA